MSGTEEMPFVKELKSELTEAVGRKQRLRRTRRRTGSIVGIGAACLLGVGVFAIAQTDRTTPIPIKATPQTANQVPGYFPEPPGGNSESLADAQQQVNFHIYAPDTPAASTENATGIHVLDNHTVEMDFPQPDAASAGLRKPYLSVWESSSGETGDPTTVLQNDVKRSGIVGESMCQVGSQPAVCVEPSSPSDAAQDNAAYVRMFINGVEVHISGGDSVQRLQDIGASLK